MEKIFHGPTTRLNIVLIKPTVKEIKEVVVKSFREHLKGIDIPGSREAFYIFKGPNPSRPDWYDYLNGRIENLPGSMTNPSLVLILRVKTQVFAVSFGYGRFLINDQAIVPDFGLKTCLNRIPSNQIKTLDKRSLEQMALHTKQQAVVPIHMSAFDIEVDRDLVKSIEGHLESSAIGSYLKGADNLTIVTKQPIDTLSLLCEELFNTYKKLDYKKEFAWIDNVKSVKDDTLISTLDSLMLDSLNDEDYHGIFLGCPEIVDDSEIRSYRLKGPRDKSSYILFPSIEQYCTVRKSANESGLLEVDNLQNDRIVALTEDNPAEKIGDWSIYRSLHAETAHEKKTYKLLEGNWYEVDKDFLKRVDSAVSDMAIFSESLPDLKIGQTEFEYNSELASALKGACLDTELISLLGRSRFEFCDVFTRSRKIIHVKKYTGAGAISHLLYQAFVSGQTFASHKLAREELAEHQIVKKEKMEAKVNPKIFKSSDYEVVIAIASTKTKKLVEALSFFSKISLAHKYRVLTALGYKVSLAQIKMVP